MGVLLVLTFGEGAGVEKVKSLRHTVRMGAEVFPEASPKI